MILRISGGGMAAAAMLVVAALFVGCQQSVPTSTVPTTARWITPTQQVLTPAGRQVELPGMRPQALARSARRGLLAVAGNSSELVLIDPVSGTIRQHVALPPDAVRTNIGEAANTNLDPTKGDRMSLNGLVFSPDGSRLFLSNVNGSIKVFAVDANDTVAPLTSFALPPAHAPKRDAEIPAGLAVSPDGRRLYVTGNLSNRLLELDAADGRVLRTWEVGVAPSDVTLAAGKAYVANLGGRRPTATDAVGPAGRGTTVRVDALSKASEGSVSIIDLRTGAVRAEILTGRHTGALAASPNGRYVVAGSAGDDTLAVIDTHTDALVEKIWARESPAELYGAQPCALTFSPDGRQLFVCNSTQNAVAVIAFEPQDGESRVTGLLPAGWFPAAIAYDPVRRELCVANLKGIGRPFDKEPKYNTKEFAGSVSLMPVLRGHALTAASAMALANLRADRLALARRPARPGQVAQPVPERTGEPSVFKHVIYILKENRAYDQILGDLPEGNCDPSLCTYGEAVTPNSHALARQFVLLDAMYCAGAQSSDGHQWTDSGFANEYVERQLVSGSPRSYPSGKDEAGADALVWASSGFIWDDARAHGKTFRNYGEWMMSEAGWADPTRGGAKRPAWADFWRDYQKGTHATRLQSHPLIPAMGNDAVRDTVGWDLRVPDVVRAQKFIADLKRAEATGEWPALTMVLLPNDHTGGTRPATPTPRAQIADNDLALGQIIAAISHSRFWRDTCVFAIEDDPQAGWDHVSGYRTTCFVASPYTRRHATVSTAYNQLSLLRTIELILGLPPMNQLDAAALPMRDCFQPVADLTPFDAVPNRVPLDEINPPPQHISSAQLRADALASARLPLDEPDRCDEDVLNQILWRAAKGDAVPYPRWAVKRDRDDD